MSWRSPGLRAREHACAVRWRRERDGPEDASTAERDGEEAALASSPPPTSARSVESAVGAACACAAQMFVSNATGDGSAGRRLARARARGPARGRAAAAAARRTRPTALAPRARAGAATRARVQGARRLRARPHGTLRRFCSAEGSARLDMHALRVCCAPCTRRSAELKGYDKGRDAQGDGGVRGRAGSQYVSTQRHGRPLFRITTHLYEHPNEHDVHAAHETRYP
jgi:hypothetical protein